MKVSNCSGLGAILFVMASQLGPIYDEYVDSKEKEISVGPIVTAIQILAYLDPSSLPHYKRSLLCSFTTRLSGLQTQASDHVFSATSTFQRNSSTPFKAIHHVTRESFDGATPNIQQTQRVRSQHPIPDKSSSVRNRERCPIPAKYLLLPRLWNQMGFLGQ